MKSRLEHIKHLFRTYGDERYGEDCSVISHSLQSGYLAWKKGLDDELVLSAFLHDIGHLVPLDNKELSKGIAEFGSVDHEAVGAEYLEETGFSDRITQTIRLHVASKRYLCASEPSYHEALSHASKSSLEYQGGPMSEKEQRIFEKNPYFKDAIEIRRIDDEAKGVDFIITDEHWDLLSLLIIQNIYDE